jgi:hypothetical protein
MMQDIGGATTRAMVSHMSSVFKVILSKLARMSRLGPAFVG